MSDMREAIRRAAAERRKREDEAALRLRTTEESRLKRRRQWAAFVEDTVIPILHEAQDELQEVGIASEIVRYHPEGQVAPGGRIGVLFVIEVSGPPSLAYIGEDESVLVVAERARVTDTGQMAVGRVTEALVRQQVLEFVTSALN